MNDRPTLPNLACGHQPVVFQKRDQPIAPMHSPGLRDAAPGAVTIRAVWCTSWRPPHACQGVNMREAEFLEYVDLTDPGWRDRYTPPKRRRG